MSVFDLATLALQVLDAQQSYFKARSGTTVDADGKRALLIASKKLEAELRKGAEGVVQLQRDRESFSACQNPECPVGCPDSHALGFQP